MVEMRAKTCFSDDRVKGCWMWTFFVCAGRRRGGEASRRIGCGRRGGGKLGFDGDLNLIFFVLCVDLLLLPLPLLRGRVCGRTRRRGGRREGGGKGWRGTHELFDIKITKLCGAFEHVDDLVEGGTRVGVAGPAGLGDARHGEGEELRVGTEVALCDTLDEVGHVDRGMDIATRKDLPETDAKGIDVDLLRVCRLEEDLWGAIVERTAVCERRSACDGT